MADDFDQQIKFQLIVDSQFAVKQLEDADKVTAKLKADLKLLADQAATTFKGASGGLPERVNRVWVVQRDLIKENIDLLKRYEEQQEKTRKAAEARSQGKETRTPGVEEDKLSEDQVKQAQEFKKLLDSLGMSVKQFETAFSRSSKVVVDETLKMYNAEGKFKESIDVSNADVNKAGQLYTQYGQAIALAKQNLDNLVKSQQIARGDTNALSQAQNLGR